jgi:hypothetical protein
MISRKPKDIWRSLCRKRYVAPRRLNQVALAGGRSPWTQLVDCDGAKSPFRAAHLSAPWGR